MTNDGGLQGHFLHLQRNLFTHYSHTQRTFWITQRLTISPPATHLRPLCIMQQYLEHKSTSQPILRHDLGLVHSVVYFRYITAKHRAVWRCNVAHCDTCSCDPRWPRKYRTYDSESAGSSPGEQQRSDVRDYVDPALLLTAWYWCWRYCNKSSATAGMADRGVATAGSFLWTQAFTKGKVFRRDVNKTFFSRPRPRPRPSQCQVIQRQAMHLTEHWSNVVKSTTAGYSQKYQLTGNFLNKYTNTHMQ